jgi:hypothetical protein
MLEYTRDDALTFVEAMRLMLNGKVGFKRTAENERLNAYLDSAGMRAEYEAYASAHPLRGDPGDADPADAKAGD